MIQDNLEYIGEIKQLICDDIKKSIKALNKLIDKDTVEYLDEFREKFVIIKKIFNFYLNKIQAKCNPDIILTSDVERFLTNFYIQFKALLIFIFDKNFLKIILK